MRALVYLSLAFLGFLWVSGRIWRESYLAQLEKNLVNHCIKFMRQRVGHKSATNIHEQVIKDSEAAKTSRAAVIDTR